MSPSYLRPLAALVLSLLSLPVGTARADDEPDPEQVVATFEKISGVHHGLRRNHTKGTCAEGSFQATEEAARYSRSALFSGRPVPAIARFSVAGPNPAVPDSAKGARGFALQFRLPEGELHQMALLNIPMFGAATVRSFHEKLLTAVPDPTTGKTDPEKLARYKSLFTDDKAQTEYLSSHNPPPSYANAAYFSLNAFQFTNSDNRSHWVKWRFEPHDGAEFLSDDELRTLPEDFLIPRITERTRKGPVQWDMIVTLGEPGDPIDNPSVPWPRERKEFKAGTLTVTRAGADAGGICDDINFDPNILSAGVDPSPDPILAFRSPAYAISFSKRMEEKQ
jgi:catalase